MVRKPVFWAAFFALSLASAWFAWRYFSHAYPIVGIRLSMNRSQAEKTARDLADRYAWSAPGYRQAASFQNDSRVQYFVELTDGGSAAFQALMRNPEYSPYTWRVRQFREGEKAETTILFRPSGQPYGFLRTLSETAAGARLSDDEAKRVAESGAAAAPWKVRLSAWRLVESSQTVRPSGRVDHTLVYRHYPRYAVGEGGELRLRLVVSGSHLTELRRFVKVPESFARRYEAMRSNNDLIALAADVAAGLLYLVGGCGIGLFLLLRYRWLLWRPATAWGFVVAFVQLLADLNEWPLRWMSYDTALSATSFVVSQVMLLFASFVGMGILLSLTFTMAEGLTRRAFPQQPQLWRSWRSGIANTPAILGRTAAGYLLAAPFLAYEVALSYLAQRALGWWSPTETLVDPNVLATYFPWLSSLAPSLQAGFWEECLFRAVPLATAALLGRHFGRRRWWIGGALILQALVFGAAHANYPNQPPYARLVELVLPAVVFGVLFLLFGLLPAILMHFAYDTLLFSLPIFVSHGTHSWVSQILVVLLALLPLWIVLASWLRQGHWASLAASERNGAWQPPETISRREGVPDEPLPMPLVLRHRKLLLAVGGAGALVAVLCLHPPGDAPPLGVNQHQVVVRAERALAARGVRLGPDWRVLPQVVAAPDDETDFVWQTAGPVAYRQLLGTYLRGPEWHVRFARFGGDVAARAEEYRVDVASDGKVVRVHHQLPEAAPGSQLTEAAARRSIEAAIRQRWGLAPNQLKAVETHPTQLKDRRDWQLVFRPQPPLPLPQGEGRIVGSISGGQVSDLFRHIHVSEQWRRRSRDRETVLETLHLLGMLFVTLFILGAVGAALLQWQADRPPPAFFPRLFLVFAVVQIASVLNRLPATVAGFSTAQSWYRQLSVHLLLALLVAVFVAAGFALVATLAHLWQQPSSARPGERLALGAAVTAVVAAAVALLSAHLPQAAPQWPSYAAAGTFSPLLGAALAPLAAYLFPTSLLLLATAAVSRWTGSGRRNRAAGLALTVAFGCAAASELDHLSLIQWTVAGLTLSAAFLFLYWSAARFDLAVVPLITAGLVVTKAISQSLAAPFSGSRTGSAIGGLVVVCSALLWWWSLQHNQPVARPLAHHQPSPDVGQNRDS